MGVQGEHHGTSAAIEFAVTVLQVCKKTNAVLLAPRYYVFIVFFRGFHVFSCACTVYASVTFGAFSYELKVVHKRIWIPFLGCGGNSRFFFSLLSSG